MLLVLTTCPAKVAPRIARTLLQARLAACVSRVDGLASEYWWEGRIDRASESLLLIKAPTRGWKALLARLKAIHPYEVPEILAFRTQRANPDYVRWLRKVTIGE